MIWKENQDMERLTLISKAKQRWRLISLLKSFGRSRIKLSSSTPLVSCHLYCSCRLILSLRLSGSNRWDIHCSASLLFTLISSNLVVVDCKYVCSKKYKIESNVEEIWPRCETSFKPEQRWKNNKEQNFRIHLNRMRKLCYIILEEKEN